MTSSSPAIRAHSDSPFIVGSAALTAVIVSSVSPWPGARPVGGLARESDALAVFGARTTRNVP
jgi:hypothetical protein